MLSKNRLQTAWGKGSFICEYFLFAATSSLVWSHLLGYFYFSMIYLATVYLSKFRARCRLIRQTATPNSVISSLAVNSSTVLTYIHTLWISYEKIIPEKNPASPTNCFRSRHFPVHSRCCLSLLWTTQIFHALEKQNYWFTLLNYMKIAGFEGCWIAKCIVRCDKKEEQLSPCCNYVRQKWARVNWPNISKSVDEAQIR